MTRDYTRDDFLRVLGACEETELPADTMANLLEDIANEFAAREAEAQDGPDAEVIAQRNHAAAETLRQAGRL